MITVRLLLAALLCASPAGAQLVTRVIDGDTIVVEGIGGVRLIGVDTPETVDPRKPVQFLGKEASAFTRGLAQGRIVRLEYDFQRTDKYNRTLAYVYLPNGAFLNAEIVKQGFGHAYVQYPFRHLDAFRAYEREAREAGRGLWGGSSAPDAATAVGQGAVDREQTVYVTRTGTKYHSAGCRLLIRSQVPMALKNVGKYGPCGVCRPPMLGGLPAKESAVAPTGPLSQPKASQPAGLSRCQATTRQGSQCSRKAAAGSGYCWQHGR